MLWLCVRRRREVYVVMDYWGEGVLLYVMVGIVCTCWDWLRRECGRRKERVNKSKKDKNCTIVGVQ